MRRRVLSGGYVLFHVLLFTALFLPPVFIPDHSMPGGREYGLWLALELWPLSCLGAGMLCALIPGVSGRVRVLSAAAGAAIACVCLLIDGAWLWAYYGGAMYGALYAGGFFAVWAIVYLVRSFLCGYREFRGKEMGK